MTDVWILVADRARARLFSPGKDAPRIIEIEDFVTPEARTPGHELGRAPRRDGSAAGLEKLDAQP